MITKCENALQAGIYDKPVYKASIINPMYLQTFSEVNPYDKYETDITLALENVPILLWFLFYNNDNNNCISNTYDYLPVPI